MIDVSSSNTCVFYAVVKCPLFKQVSWLFLHRERTGRMVIIFVWKKHENMFPCTGSRVITSYEWIASCAGTRFRSQASGPQCNSAIMSSVLTTRPWLVRQKRTGTSCMVSHTRHNNRRWFHWNLCVKHYWRDSRNYLHVFTHPHLK